MARHEALYRKYRPQTFGDLEGQDPISRTLRNEIRQGRLTHAYLFTGPRGTGKTTTARLLAKALNCVGGAPEGRDGADPCGVCRECRAIESKAHMDVIEIDAASNRGIDDIRSLQERAQMAPAQGRAKVFVVDEVHMLSDAAWNALLKTLEEPPSHCTFVLATTEVHKVLPTVVSRCQRFDFRRIPLVDLSARLEKVAGLEDLQLEPEALAELARRADGGLRDGLSLLEQVAATVEPDETGLRRIALGDVAEALGLVPEDAILALGEALLTGDVAVAMQQCRVILASGHDHRAVLRELLAWTRDLVLLRVAPDALDGSGRRAGALERLRGQALRAPEALTDAFLAILRETDGIMRGAPQWQIWLEVALLRLTRPFAGVGPAAGSPDALAGLVTSLEARIAGLERRLARGGGDAGELASARPAAAGPSASSRVVEDVASTQTMPVVADASSSAASSQADDPSPLDTRASGPPAVASSTPLAPHHPPAGVPWHDEGGAFGEAVRRDLTAAPSSGVPLPPASPAGRDRPLTVAPPASGGGEDVAVLVKDAISRGGLAISKSAMLLGQLRSATLDPVANRVTLVLNSELAAYKDGEEGRRQLEDIIRGCFNRETTLALMAYKQAKTPLGRPAGQAGAVSSPARAVGAATSHVPALPPAPVPPAPSQPVPMQEVPPPGTDSLEDVVDEKPGGVEENLDEGRAGAARIEVAFSSPSAEPPSRTPEPAGDPEGTVQLAAEIFLGRVIRG